MYFSSGFHLKLLTYWLTNKSLLDSRFWILREVSLSLYGSETKNYCPVSFLSVVRRIYDEPMNDDEPWEIWYPSWFQIWFLDFSLNCRLFDSFTLRNKLKSYVISDLFLNFISLFFGRARHVIVLDGICFKKLLLRLVFLRQCYAQFIGV